MTNFEQFKAELDAVCKKFGVGLGIRGEDAEQWVTAFDRIDAQCVWFEPRVEDWPEANEPYVQPDVSEQVEGVMGMIRSYGHACSAGWQAQPVIEHNNIQVRLTELLRGVK